MYPFVRTGMTDDYAGNERVFGRWQPRMLETHEAAEAILALLARPAEETDHGMFELLCDEPARGRDGAVDVTWKRVRLDVVEERLDWSADQPLRYP